jgi:hypothetical protein
LLVKLGWTQFEQQAAESLRGQLDRFAQLLERFDLLRVFDPATEGREPQTDPHDRLQRVVVDPDGDALTLLFRGAHEQAEQVSAVGVDALELGHRFDQLGVDHLKLLMRELRADRPGQR